MALLILHKDRTSIIKIADNQEEAVFLLPNLSYYQDNNLVYDISSEDKEGLRKNVKKFDEVQNNVAVISDIQDILSADVSKMSEVIKIYISQHKEILNIDRVKLNSTYKQKVENNISLLEAINVDALTYPINSPEKYIIENHVPNLITGLQRP